MIELGQNIRIFRTVMLTVWCYWLYFMNMLWSGDLMTVVLTVLNSTWSTLPPQRACVSLCASLSNPLHSMPNLLLSFLNTEIVFPNLTNSPHRPGGVVWASLLWPSSSCHTAIVGAHPCLHLAVQPPPGSEDRPAERARTKSRREILLDNLHLTTHRWLVDKNPHYMCCHFSNCWKSACMCLYT